jgi:large subunit ribosomal protein L34
MPKRTFQPKRRKRVKTHGFRKRMETKKGQQTISKRRTKKRAKLSVSQERRGKK